MLNPKRSNNINKTNNLKDVDKANVKHYGVLYGKIDHGQETVLLKKVFKSYEQSIDYVEAFVKSYITNKCGSEWYSNKALDCVCISDLNVKNRADGYYLIKNNNSWSVYSVNTEITEGYMGQYAKKFVEHVFNIYIAKEGGHLTTLTRDYSEHSALVDEIKLKVGTVDKML